VSPGIRADFVLTFQFNESPEPLQRCFSRWSALIMDLSRASYDVFQLMESAFDVGHVVPCQGE
jgi:hypothetical protein